MTEQEIRGGAPDGATHYEIEDMLIYYYKFDKINLYIWNDRKKFWIKRPIEWAKDIKPL